MSGFGEPTKVKWHEIEKVGRPTAELRTYSVGGSQIPRTFLCRGAWSIFTSRMYDDGSGFEEETDDAVKSWAVIDGF